MQNPSPLDPDGLGAPIVLLHSSGLSSHQWRRLISTLAPRHRVVAHDFLGCGANPPWPSELGFDLQMEVDRVLASCDMLKQPVHLVGHSYGAFVALRLALCEPSRVVSLALYEPLALGVLDSVDDEDALDDLVQLAPLFDLSHLPLRMASKRFRVGSWAPPADGSQIPIGSEEWLRTFTNYWAGDTVWSSMPEGTRASFLRAGHKIYHEMRAATFDRTPASEYRRIDVPTLLMCGGRSPEPGRHITSRLAEVMPRARFQEFPSAGHLGPITHSTQINEMIHAHLRALE